ncbi:hypothetical protein DYH09_32265 [bacterium CPR1]|nr:hypothetical protein [bacterium CPR1]
MAPSRAGSPGAPAFNECGPSLIDEWVAHARVLHDLPGGPFETRFTATMARRSSQPAYRLAIRTIRRAFFRRSFRFSPRSPTSNRSARWTATCRPSAISTTRRAPGRRPWG